MTKNFTLTQMGHALEIRGEGMTDGGVLLDNIRSADSSSQLHHSVIERDEQFDASFATVPTK